MDMCEIADTLHAAKIYLKRLKLLDNDLQCAVKQITTTFQETEESIKQTFANLKNTLGNILDKREKCLLDQAQKIKNEGVAPLQECRSVISEKISLTNKLIITGNSVTEGQNNKLDTFTKNASLLGSLPEIPELKEVPYISFHFDTSDQNDVIDLLKTFGGIYRIAPIQISELIERPGALLVEWHVIDSEERMTDIQEFRLQRAYGDVIKEKHLIVNFIDCYIGSESQYLVKDLQAGQPYSFRISCKFEGTREWSPWSLPQVSYTSLKPFSWKINDDFLITSENKIAQPLKKYSSILFSDGPQFLAGHSVEFTFLETEESIGDALVGLIAESLQPSTTNLKFAGMGSFLINREGKIYVDGVVKSTVLPKFIKNLKVSFTCCKVNEERIRMNVESNEKMVTYDWLLNANSKMFIVSQFSSTNWKILIE